MRSSDALARLQDVRLDFGDGKMLILMDPDGS